MALILSFRQSFLGKEVYLVGISFGTAGTNVSD